MPFASFEPRLAVRLALLDDLWGYEMAVAIIATGVVSALVGGALLWIASGSLLLAAAAYCGIGFLALTLVFFAGLLACRREDREPEAPMIAAE